MYKQGAIEKTYGKLFRYATIAINPFKKVVIQTECQIHKFINFKSLDILKNDNFEEANTFFSDFIVQLNEGAVWADQDFKSSGHFYSPIKNKGLFGNKDALSLATEYYSYALEFWKSEDTDLAMFYLGATIHLVQDMTVPQHANIKLLDEHRQFENFIKKIYLFTPEFVVSSGGYYVESIEEAIRFNARNAMKVYSKLKDIADDNLRYYTISKFMIPLAIRTSAGCLMRFYKDIAK
jgi:phospholipase C